MRGLDAGATVALTGCCSDQPDNVGGKPLWAGGSSPSDTLPPGPPKRRRPPARGRRRNAPPRRRRRPRPHHPRGFRRFRRIRHFRQSHCSGRNLFLRRPSSRYRRSPRLPCRRSPLFDRRVSVRKDTRPWDANRALEQKSLDWGVHSNRPNVGEHRGCTEVAPAPGGAPGEKWAVDLEIFTGMSRKSKV